MDNNIRGAFEIGDALVSLDLAERFFCCDIDACLGACCIEGDAGAPITKEEFDKLKEVLPVIWDDLLPRAQEQIKEHGVGYLDPEGEIVTQIVDGKNCVFSTYLPGGVCGCAKAMPTPKALTRMPPAIEKPETKLREYVLMSVRVL